MVDSTQSLEIFWLELLVSRVGHDSASMNLLLLSQLPLMQELYLPKNRVELAQGCVASRMAIIPDDFLAWSR